MTIPSSPPFHTLDLQFQDLPQVIAAYLIPGPEGWILVEAGPYSCWDTLQDRLAQHQVRPSDIRDVLLTHIHLDHAGAAWALAREGARIHVHPAGAAHLADPSRLMASARRIYQDQMDRLWGDMQSIPSEQIITADNQDEVTCGGLSFIAHHTPGHAIHHIAWQMGNTLFTGDVAGIHIGQGLVAPPCPPPEFDREAWKQSIQIMRDLPVDTLALTHFGLIHDKNQHLDALEEALDLWVAFFEEQPDLHQPAELTERFVQYIHQDFYDSTMDADLRAQYDYANPPWMSVAGISRYLIKREEQF